MGRYTGILGLLTMLALAYAFSTNRRAIRVKTVAWGLSLQIAFAIFVLRIDFGRRAFQVMGDAANKVLSYSFIGSEFLFGPLGKQSSNIGFIFAFQVLPVVIFICALFAILYHVGIMQIVIRAMAWAMTRIMGASGAESLNVAASIFMGQTEAPVTIRPFLPDLTRSELMTVMTSGRAHVSGGIMAAYIAFGIEPKHLLSAVIMTAPGTLLMAKMLVPETEQPRTAGRVVMPEGEEETEKEENLLGAVARGTTEGLHMALNIAAMLIAFSMLGPLKAALDPRSFTIATFALCGFANLSSIGIQIGGIGALAPNKKAELARLGLRAMLAGTMANLMSASIVGVMLQ